MTRLEQLKVCKKLCYPSLGTQLIDSQTPKGNKEVKRVYVPPIRMNEKKDIPYPAYKIICEQVTKDCVLIHFCAKAALKELALREVNLETAEEVQQLWKKSFIESDSKYSRLLSKIRCLILVAVAKNCAVQNSQPGQMKEIISQASEAIYPTQPF